MKLYLSATNTKGKTEGVGDNVQIDTSFMKGNKVEYTAHYTTEGIMVYKQGVIVLDTITKGVNLQGEKCAVNSCKTIIQAIQNAGCVLYAN